MFAIALAATTNLIGAFTTNYVFYCITRFLNGTGESSFENIQKNSNFKKAIFGNITVIKSKYKIKQELFFSKLG